MPLQALKTFRCVENLGGAPLLVTAMIPHLRSISDLRIAIFLPGDNDVDISFHVPPIVLAISALSFEIFEDFSPDDARRPLESFIASLTLPCLTSLFLDAVEHPRTSLPWPHSQFLSLSERSSFHAHLTKLYLCEVIITESELLQSLAVLPALEWLTISDQLAVLPDHAEHLLITFGCAHKDTQIPMSRSATSYPWLPVDAQI
ncbi:hypothetical protein C8R44DRAFT_790549 [Mycena epipterygia]|nr:hypothetical protein C8R44DRAFT_790549 [Mycena epipterygia]